MDFRLGQASEEFRAEVRRFLDEHLTAEVVERAWRTGTMHDWGFHRALAAKGWLAAAWPPELGGQGRDPFEMAALTEEMAYRGAPVDGWGTSELVANTLRVVGTEEQRRSVIPRILSGEVIVCLGYSEPDSGSDVAAAKTRAQRQGDEWVIDGQKVFTTLAHEAAYVFLLTRTDPEAPKHLGLTMFLVPMDTPGIEVVPVRTLGGERTNMTFYTGVRVPDSCRVGEVNGGWEVMKVALAFERQPAANQAARRLLRQVEEWARQALAPGGARVIDSDAARLALAKAAVAAEVGKLLGHRMHWLASRGRLPVVEGSMAKLFGSEAFREAASQLLGLAGPAGVLEAPDPRAPAGGWIGHAFRHAQVTTIYAGSSEIQRSIIAERGLGLPRARPPG